MAKLTSDQIDAAVKKTPGWKLQNGSITRTVAHKDFVGAMAFVNKVAPVAEAAGHHPDIDIRWNKVTLTLSTHSEGGLTQKDFDLARQIDALVNP
jgi:4a-hydroxytetrahydrobiopterin dehydratase